MRFKNFKIDWRYARSFEEAREQRQYIMISGPKPNPDQNLQNLVSAWRLHATMNQDDARRVSREHGDVVTSKPKSKLNPNQYPESWTLTLTRF